MFEGRPAQIMIIDDNLINRKKLKMAVESLGYSSAAMVDGVSGLDALQGGGYDALLLDMLMPEMDGFEVLTRLQADPVLRDLPVIVVSDLEGDTEAVSRAITLGAEDFLPKRFDPVILNARLTACLRKKQFRDMELEYFRRINTLTDAAGQVEAGRFDAASDSLSGEAGKDDPVGRLALVFQGMAREIHTREVKLLRRIQTLQCSLLLLLCGGGAGLIPSLSKMAAGLGANPFGMAVWVNLFAAFMCGVVVVARGGFPRLMRSDLAFFAVWALVVGVLQQISIFVLAGQVPATFLTLALALEGLIVFAFAALMRTEKATPLRVGGLLLGLVGVGLSLSERMDGTGIAANFWLFAALVTPLLFAFETIAVAAKRPDHVPPTCAVGLMFGISSVFALGLAAATGNMIAPQALMSPLGGLIVALAVTTAMVNVTFLIILKMGGSVFTSQKAYVTAVSGIIWGIVLLGETLSTLAIGAGLLVLIGMYLVGSKESDEPIVIKRDFTN